MNEVRCQQGRKHFTVGQRHDEKGEWGGHQPIGDIYGTSVDKRVRTAFVDSPEYGVRKRGKNRQHQRKRLARLRSRQLDNHLTQAISPWAYWHRA